ncbi:hypothetical protein GS464_29555 [Rhodococcus hoagii]|nr:hypothetical protein [Prescottella equi]
MAENTQDELTRELYVAMQLPYLSERHDALVEIVNAEVNKVLDELEAIGSVQYDIEAVLSAIEKARKS